MEIIIQYFFITIIASATITTLLLFTSTFIYNKILKTNASPLSFPPLGKLFSYILEFINQINKDKYNIFIFFISYFLLKFFNLPYIEIIFIALSIISLYFSYSKPLNGEISSIHHNLYVKYAYIFFIFMYFIMNYVTIFIGSNGKFGLPKRYDSFLVFFFPSILALIIRIIQKDIAGRRDSAAE
jgi:hypothetical protein